MAKNGTVAYMHKAPNCDFCKMGKDGKEVKAEYDAKTKLGPWAWLCKDHYVQHRYFPTLGTGKGQKIELRPDAVSAVKQAGS